MRSDREGFDSLENLGPKSRKWLEQVGIHDRADLEALGSVMAYRILKDRFPAVSLNMLYALEGALIDRHWNAFTPEEKARLRKEVEMVVRVDAPNASTLRREAAARQARAAGELKVPRRLASTCRDVPERMAWLERLPAVIEVLQRRWSLTLGQPFEDASCAWVAPVIRKDGSTAVIKLSMPHLEGEHEVAGLKFWNGDPTVHLLDAEAEFGAMLLERCMPGSSLRGRPESDQDDVIARLLRRLWRVPPASSQFRPLEAMLNAWRRVAMLNEDHWTDEALVREGLQLFEELPRTAQRHVLLATDLHAGNVLKADREPWLMIDPKPFVGDPAYDATQHLLNCGSRLRVDPEGTIRRFSDLIEVDSERVRLWTFARAAAEWRHAWSDQAAMELARRLAP